MSSRDVCPDDFRLKGLLDGTLPEDAQAELVGHLEGCPACQGRLEELAAGRRSWSEAAVQLGAAEPPPGEALREVMARLKREAGPDTRAEAEGAWCADLPPGLLGPPAEPGSLGRLAHYEVLEVIGRGGMAVVLKARDTSLQRVVAIKVLAAHLARNGGARQRFVREARAAAAVCHEHVVTIHAVDEANDVPYLVMQYVPGASLQDKLDRCGPLELKEVLRIGMQAAQGLAAAHKQGLVHRDVKPANILLENGVERVKLTDFGLARAADDASLTQSGVIAGTPQYMAPEQAAGEAVDHRADLFSLGSVLYAMCTGRPPFRARNTMAVLRRVCEDEPRSVRAVNPDLPEWLEAIIARLHAKDPDDRFPSAAEVADVLGEHLAYLQRPRSEPRPVPVARPARPSRPSRRRRPSALAWVLVAVGVLAFSCCLFPAGVLYLFLGEQGPMGPSGSAILTPQVAEEAGAEWPMDEDPVDEEPDARLTLPHVDPAFAVAFSPDSKTLASGAGDGTIRTWDAGSGQRLKSWNAFHKAAITSLVYSHNGTRLASGDRGGSLAVWMAAEPGVSVGKLERHAGRVRGLAFSPDGRWLASASDDHSAKVWDLDKMAEQQSINGNSPVTSVAFSADGRLLGVGASNLQSDPGIVFSANNWTPRYWLRGEAGPLLVAFAPDCQTAATAQTGRGLFLWDLPRRVPRLTVTTHGLIECLAYSPDGKLLVTAGSLAPGPLSSGLVEVWDAASGQPVQRFHGHGRAVHAVAFARDGKALATASEDGTVKVWNLPKRP
jgi:serine/threonine protein kinase